MTEIFKKYLYKTAYKINCKPPSDDLYAKLRPKVFFLVNLI